MLQGVCIDRVVCNGIGREWFPLGFEGMSTKCAIPPEDYYD